jgi:hypothetical protein
MTIIELFNTFLTQKEIKKNSMQETIDKCIDMNLLERNATIHTPLNKKAILEVVSDMTFIKYATFNRPSGEKKYKELKDNIFNFLVSKGFKITQGCYQGKIAYAKPKKCVEERLIKDSEPFGFYIGAFIDDEINMLFFGTFDWLHNPLVEDVHCVPVEVFADINNIPNRVYDVDPIDEEKFQEIEDSILKDIEFML